jgi:hypothetical protein
MIDDSLSLRDLRADFLRTSTRSMPLAGLIAWSALGVAGVLLPPRLVGMLALYIMAFILPLAFVLEKLQGRTLFAGGSDNPLVKLFLASIGGMGVTVPVVILGARAAHEPTLIVLGMAILAGVIWIPYGWASGDATGLRHAIARAVGAYAAYALAPAPYRATAICAVVAVAYVYSLVSMKRPAATFVSK